MQLKFLAPKEGAVHYEIHAMCSAYLGADKKVLMKKTIAKKKEEEERAKTAAEIAEDEDEEDEEEEEEPEGKWYYLGGNSVGELNHGRTPTVGLEKPVEGSQANATVAVCAHQELEPRCGKAE